MFKKNLDKKFLFHIPITLSINKQHNRAENFYSHRTTTKFKILINFSCINFFYLLSLILFSRNVYVQSFKNSYLKSVHFFNLNALNNKPYIKKKTSAKLLNLNPNKFR